MRHAPPGHEVSYLVGAPPVVLDGKVATYADQLTPLGPKPLVQPAGQVWFARRR